MAIPDAPGPQTDRIGPKPIEISDVSQLDGMIVNAEVLEYGDRKGPPVGRVIEVLGSPDDFGIDVEIVIRKHHLPNRFPAEVIDEAQIDSVRHHRRRNSKGGAISAICRS